MDMYKKREQRKENKPENETKEMTKAISINWYPGHMSKTRRQIKENIRLIDIILEVVDARLPYSSKIKDVEDIIRTKKHILVMTKKDLCDESITSKWVEHYKKLGIKVLLMDLTNNQDYKKLYRIIEEQTKELQDKRELKGLEKKEVKALVIGVPNAGKSTLINALAGKKVAITGNKPGVTKSVNWLKTNAGILLMDTPGILWPKIDEDSVALNLASMTAIKSDILNITDIANHIMTYLGINYPDVLFDRYKAKYNEDILIMYEEIAKSIGALRNGEVDYDKVALKVYNDIASGKLKGVTFDKWI